MRAWMFSAVRSSLLAPATPPVPTNPVAGAGAASLSLSVCRYASKMAPMDIS